MKKEYQRLIWVHTKTGHLYQIVCFAKVEATLGMVVVYQTFAQDAGTERHTWTRPVEEFFDGRFTHFNEKPRHGAVGLPKTGKPVTTAPTTGLRRPPVDDGA